MKLDITFTVSVVRLFRERYMQVVNRIL